MSEQTTGWAGADPDAPEVPQVNTKGFVGRELTDHKVNRFNRECVLVTTADERASDNAHHAYQIDVYKFEQPKNEAAPKACSVLLPFQNGGLRETGANGITD